MSCKVTMLYVGQGAMSLIETYNEDEQLVHLAMIDCGTDDPNEVYGDAVSYAREKMEERYQCSQEGELPLYLDVLVLSHCDQDHWKLFDVLFSNLNGIVWKRYNGSYFYVSQEQYYEIFARNEEEINAYTRVVGSKKADIVLSFGFPDDGSLFVKIEYCSQEIYGGCNLEIVWCPGELNGKIVLQGRVYRLITNEQGVYLNLIGKTDSEKVCDEAPESFEMLQSWFVEFWDQAIEIEVDEEEVKSFIQLPYMTREDIEHEFALKSEQKDQNPVWIGNVHIGGIPNPNKIRFRVVYDEICQHADSVYERWEELQDISTTTAYRLVVAAKIPVNYYPVCRAKSMSQESIRNNATSLVLVFDDQDQKVVFPGDATAHTFHFLFWKMNGILVPVEEKQEYRTLMESADWLAPHHGSIQTLVGMVWQNGVWQELFPKFMENVKPQKMCISAGENNRHGHPHKAFVEMMCEYYETNEISDEEHTIHYNEVNSSQPEYQERQMGYPLYTHCTEIPEPYCVYMEQPIEVKKEKATIGEIPKMELFFYR